MGNLNIFALYADASSPTNRLATVRRLSRAPVPSNATIVATGDFNFVESHGDRWSLTRAMAAGDKDCREKRGFRSDFLDRWGLHEMQQDGFTFRNSDCLSRLDRF